MIYINIIKNVYPEYITNSCNNRYTKDSTIKKNKPILKISEGFE